MVPWPYLPSSHMPKWNTYTSADPETLVSFTHLCMYTLRHLVFKTDHNLPSCIFFFSLFMHICYAAIIFISLTTQIKILSVWKIFPFYNYTFWKRINNKGLFQVELPKRYDPDVLKQHEASVSVSQEAGSGTERQPAGFMSHLHYRPASTSYETSQGLSFCLYTMETTTVSIDECRKD